MIHVTDTHSLLWFLARDKRLSRAAFNALNNAAIPLTIPSIVLAEIAFLYSRGRVTVSVTAVLSELQRFPNSRIFPLDEVIARMLPTGLEMHDSIIVATTMLLDQTTGQEVALITRDEQITVSGLVLVIW